MRKTTSTILVGLLGVGSAVALSLAVPGVASASSCADTPVSQKDLQGFDLKTETGTAGYAKFVAGGLEVGVTETSSQGKSKGYRSTGGAIPLDGQTAQANYSIVTDKGPDVYPQGFSYQLLVDKDGNGGFDQYLVYEPAYYGAGNWHTNTKKANDPNTYEFTGDLDAYVDANPNAQLLGFGYSFGSTVPVGSVLVKSITFGCNTFVFGRVNEAPTAAFTTNDAGDQSYRTVGFDGTTSTDPDSDTLTYSWNFGDGTTGAGVTTSHTYPAGTKTYTVTLTVSDGSTSDDEAKSITVTRSTDTLGGTKLPNTGANVMGMAALGAVVIAGSGAGLVATRRRGAKHSA